MLVERVREMGLLQARLAESVRGIGRVVLVSGPGASGKTALVRLFAEHVAESGPLVLSASCSQVEQCHQFGVAEQLLRSAPLPEEVSAQAEAVLTVLREPMPGPSGAGLEQTPQVAGLSEIVLALARRRPVLLIIDDIEFIDEATKLALRYLQRRIASAPVMIVLTEPAQPRSADPPFLAELSRQPYFSRITLARLTKCGISELLVAHFDESAGNLAPEVQRLTGGNPLLVKALIEDNRPQLAAGGTPGQPAVGGTYRQSALSCLHRWEAPLLDCSRVVALLGRHANPDLVQQLLNDLADEGFGVKVSPVAVTRALAALTESGLMTANRLVHPTVEQVVLSDVPPDMWTAMHARAAVRLHADGAPASVVARYLLAVGEASGAWAVPVLEQAADQALAEHHLSESVDCLKLALTACDTTVSRVRITARLVNVQWQINPSAAARHIDTLKDAARAGDLGWREALALVRQVLRQGETDEAVDLLGDLETSAPKSCPQYVRELNSTLQWLRYFQPPVHDRVEGMVNSQTVPIVVTTDPPRLSTGRNLTALTPASQASSTPRSEDSTGWAEQLLQGCRLPETQLESVLTALYALIYSDELDRATHWCDSIRSDAVASAAFTWAAALADIRAHIALRRGDLLNAEHFSQVALSTLSPHSWGVAIGSPLANLIMAATGTGDVEKAEKALRVVLPEGMRSTLCWPMYLRARGMYHLHRTDRLRAALEDFETCGNLLSSWNIDHPTLIPWRTDVAQVLVRMGRTDEARDLVRAQLTGVGGGYPRVRGQSLRILASTSDVQRRVAILRESVELLQESGDQLQLSLALAGLSATHSALGDLSRARLIARRAIQTAKSCHGEAFCRRLLPHAATLPLADDDAESGEGDAIGALSDAERRVAALAAAGHTNRDISRKLFITVSTVEQHLTHVYRKLNVSRRTDLPGELRLSIAGG